MTQETVLFYAAIAAAVCVPIAIALLFFSLYSTAESFTDARDYGAGDCASQMTSEDVDRFRQELRERMGDSGYCEHCGVRGKCAVCRSDHGDGEAA